MAIITKTIKIEDEIYKTIIKIVKKENKTEEAIIKESLEKIIEEKEIIAERLKFPNATPLEVVADEFGETPIEFIKKLEEAESEISVPLDVDKFEKKYGV